MSYESIKMSGQTQHSSDQSRVIPISQNLRYKRYPQVFDASIKQPVACFMLVTGATHYRLELLELEELDGLTELELLEELDGLE
jgi:hypothetical protein